MYRDGYGETGWMRFLRILTANFRLGRFFGVELRVFWLTLIVLPLILLFEFADWPISALEVITLTVLVTVPLYFVVWTHEMGHILAARRYGIWTPLITLSPVGGLAHLSSGAPRPKDDIVISLAGPAVHLLWLAVFWPLSFLVDPFTLLPSGWLVSPVWFAVDFLVDMNLWLLAFNLLPFFPMDGGRVFRAFLATRMHPNKATLIAVRVGQVGAVAIGLTGLFLGEMRGAILLAIGLTNFFACRRELMAARHGMGPYMGVDQRQAWESDPEGWKQGGVATGRSAEPGFFARRKAKREAADRARKQGDAARLEEEMDRVLARVSEVGVSGLTRAERKILDRASKARRGGG